MVYPFYKSTFTKDEWGKDVEICVLSIMSHQTLGGWIGIHWRTQKDKAFHLVYIAIATPVDWNIQALKQEQARIFS